MNGDLDPARGMCLGLTIGGIIWIVFFIIGFTVVKELVK
jgi:hypothetical protein